LSAAKQAEARLGLRVAEDSRAYRPHLTEPNPMFTFLMFSSLFGGCLYLLLKDHKKYFPPY
jgi:hypothetical protein